MPAVATMPAESLPAGESAALLGQIAGLTSEMRRFARRRVRDEALAEDAVQDALLAALGSVGGFQGSSSLKTWLFGILTHKIQDGFRRETRYVRFGGEADDDGHPTLAADPDALHGHDPLLEVARRRLMTSIVAEVESLPDSLRHVFLMQAVQGLPTETVCAQLGISEANCWVRLHRARKRLSGRLAAHR